ncbi:MAG: Sodium/hydrogen exchanger [Candidatus Curtissbacteria bacterium GW2011_GWA1_40_9]|uniref:Sodium/hydrogen exchanger n=1 Tax=Candidatus Curtissbacteria bacterium GW2011_GWA1_40_9 TaxID=1618408 RepID=A0A0G0TMP0_9BACT|nr:MAG: Sodium/hydrogen exchanger [Candidatus Curtissbacteria bacterium GW2011_GWA1_40_9]
MPHQFLSFAFILVLAAGLGIIARTLKQPLVLAYIFAGIIISAASFFGEFDTKILEPLSNFGIAFLLFLTGIDMKLEDLKYVGRAALYTGIGQIVFTALVGFVILSALGFSTVASIYIAVAITFSSTVIIVKLLSEKNDLQSLYGKIAVGFLLVQDFVAIIALMVLSGFAGGQTPSIVSLGFILVKGVLLVAATILFTKFVMKSIFRLASSSIELLFVVAIAWAFLLSGVAEFVGFSIAIGAFLAGIAIASSPYRVQISGRVKPLKDFFIIIFFILLGVSMSSGFGNLNIMHVVLVSLFILIGNPLIVMAVMMTLKFRNRTSFLASVTVAQISEFSLILMAVAQSLGHVGSREVALVASVGVITITLSSYLILYGNAIYAYVQKPMSKLFPEKARDPYVTRHEELKDHVVLVGGEQMGSDILSFLSGKIQDRDQIVVIDFNPEIHARLSSEGYNAVFGDVTDPEVLEELELGRARLLVITDPDAGDSAHIIQMAREKNFKGPVIGTAYWIHDAIKLYEMGADYVVVPETVGGKHVSRILADHWEDLGKIKKEKSKHFEDLISHRIF